MAMWMKFRLLTSGDPDDEMDIKAVVGEVRMPTTVPWWFRERFEQWKAVTKSARELTWDDFLIEDFVDEICSMNRPIPLWKPLFPKQRFRYAFGGEDQMNDYEAKVKDLMEQQIDPATVIDEDALRTLGFILDEDLESKSQAEIEALMAKGWRRINIADSTMNSLMPWTKKSYLAWVPLSNPEQPRAYKLHTSNVLGVVEWDATPAWIELVNSIWGQPIVTSETLTPLTTES